MKVFFQLFANALYHERMPVPYIVDRHSGDHVGVALAGFVVNKNPFGPIDVDQIREGICLTKKVKKVVRIICHYCHGSLAEVAADPAHGAGPAARAGIRAPNLRVLMLFFRR